MFRTLRQLFRRKHPATKRVLSERERALNARDESRNIDEHQAFLDTVNRGLHKSHDYVELDTDTRMRIHRKAQNPKPTPIWPVGCHHVVVSSVRPKPDMERLADIFSPNPIPSVIAVSTAEDVQCAYWRNVTVMVASLGTVDIILRLHKAGAHLIDPWGKPLDLTLDETDAERQGRAMREGAARRDPSTNLDAAFLPDFHTCRYTEDLPSPPPIVGVMDDENNYRGDGGSFGGAGASGGWDMGTPNGDTSVSCDNSTSDSGSCDSSTSGD